MSEWVTCPVCTQGVHNSHNGWQRHTDGPRHHLVAMGLDPDKAERIIAVCANAGVSYEVAMSALRQTLTMPASEIARRMAELYAFAQGFPDPSAVGSAVDTDAPNA